MLLHLFSERRADKFGFYISIAGWIGCALVFINLITVVLKLIYIEGPGKSHIRAMQAFLLLVQLSSSVVAIKVEIYRFLCWDQPGYNIRGLRACNKHIYNVVFLILQASYSYFPLSDSKVSK